MGRSWKTRPKMASITLSVHQVFQEAGLSQLHGKTCVVEAEEEGAGTLHVTVLVTLPAPDN